MDGYHDHPAISRTGLSCFRESRRLYHARHVLRLPEAQLTPTPQINLGILCHAELLEPGTMEGRFAVMPKELLSADGGIRSKAAKAWRDERIAEGLMVVKEEDIAEQVAIVESAMAVAANWFSPQAAIEQPIYWTDPETGLECRCKPDWLIPASAGRPAYVFDFKTTADASPSRFAKQVDNLELWLQDKHYSRGVNLSNQHEGVEFFFVAVESKFPYRASVHQIEDDRGLLAAEYQDTLRALNGCMKTGNWAEPWEHRVNVVTVREFALKSDAIGG